MMVHEGKLGSELPIRRVRSLEKFVASFFDLFFEVDYDAFWNLTAILETLSNHLNMIEWTDKSTEELYQIQPG